MIPIVITVTPKMVLMTTTLTIMVAMVVGDRGDPLPEGVSTLLLTSGEVY